MPYLTVSYSDSAAIIIYCTCRIPCRTHYKGHPTRLGELKGAYWQNTGSIARTARPLQTDLNRMTDFVTFRQQIVEVHATGDDRLVWQTGDDRIFQTAKDDRTWAVMPFLIFFERKPGRQDISAKLPSRRGNDLWSEENWIPAVSSIQSQPSFFYWKDE
jgi:hypothetical protein